jgi:hypothetical protein
MSYYTDQRIINLSSESANVYKNGSYLSYLEFNFNDFIKPEENIINISCSVQNASIPLSFYIINEYNNKLEYSFNGINKTIVNFDLGNYNATSFITQFKSKTPFDITFNKANGKFTFSYSSTFYFHFQNSTCFNILGFNKNNEYQSVTNIINAPHLADFSGIRTIKIRSSRLGNYNLDSISGGSFNDLVTIPVDVGYYGIIVYNNQVNFKSLLNTKYVSFFDIQIVDGYNDELINFNNVGWTITLQFDILRKLEEETNLINNNLNNKLDSLISILLGNSQNQNQQDIQSQQDIKNMEIEDQTPLDGTQFLETEPTTGDETLDFLLYKNKLYS